jgi:hypothetical protein
MNDRLRPIGVLKGALRSYGIDLRHWIGRVERRYITVCALALLGVSSLVGSLFIGASALFSMIEARLGLYVAYEIVGGTLLLIGLMAILGAAALLKRKLPHLPSARPHAQNFKRSVTLSAATRLAFGGAQGRSQNPTTNIIAGVAAALVIGWIAASHMSRDPGWHRDAR